MKAQVILNMHQIGSLENYSLCVLEGWSVLEVQPSKAMQESWEWEGSVNFDPWREANESN